MVPLAGCGTSASGTADVAERLRSVNDCPPGYNIIEGTDRDDVLVGTSGNDCILGYDGNDVLRGGAGDDYLVGGPGDDLVYGLGGVDWVFGESGNDTVLGGVGDDTLSGGAGDDQVQGNVGNDTLAGGEGNDFLSGGSGDDFIEGGGGDDEIKGDEGDDVLVGGPGKDQISGGPGSNAIIDDVGDAVVSVASNAWPEISNIVPEPTRIDTGASTKLNIIVTDPDADPLIFAWTADCVGSFDDPAAAEPTFTLVALDDIGCTLTVEVTDGRGGSTAGEVTIETGPGPEVQIDGN
jgi:Ca2+-binding RTX toxin-like protein